MNVFSDRGLWLTILISSVILLISFPALLLHGNETMFSAGGDGLKNYFTVLFYLQQNNGVHFSGMNYPFGEHISFADAQTGIAVPMQWLSSIFPSLKNNGLALINYAVFAGIVAGAASFYLLLKQFGISRSVAVTGALLISFLSPQLFRIEAHFGLSYIFFFPLSIFLFLKTKEKPNWKRFTATIVLIAWIGLLHFYLAVIVCLFLFAFALLQTVTGFKKINRKTLLLPWIIPIAVLVLLQLFIFFTDTVTDRPSKPWGFFSALADVKTVFLPHSTDLLGKPVSGYPVVAEGFAYIGAAAILFLLLFLSTAVYRAVVKKTVSLWHPFSSKEMLLFAGSILLLLFSMGVPFVWHLEFLVDKISFLRQFRGLGRFAWPFYYITGMFTIIYCYRIYTTATGKAYRMFLFLSFFAVAGLWAAECIYRVKGLQRLDNEAHKNHLRFHGKNYGSLLAKANVYPSDFQAILCFPFYHIGSEKFSIDYWPSPFYSMKAAMQTGLPVVNVMLSRTSLSQSSATVQLLSDSLIEKQLISKLPTQRPFLLITSGNQFSANELRLIQQAELLITDGEIAMYKLPLTAFDAPAAAARERYFNKKDQLYNYGLYQSTVDSSKAVLKFFDPSTAFSAASIINNSKVKKPLLLDTVLNGYSDNDTLHVSLWIQIEPEKDALPLLEIEQLHQNKQAAYTELPFKWATDVLANRVRVTGTFVLKQKSNRVRITLSEGSKYMNLLIKKPSEDIYVPAGSNAVYFNNIPLKLN